ncbi:MAG: PD-(D/E)XK nuclease family protein [Myxococcales bacterium]|nr:PD-(D/E)XK nuclease family protein [Myxococcales bacterium]
MTSFYQLEAPTSWAAPPDHFSFSSLQAIGACPRKWQLLHSEWGEHGRFPQRPHPKALEGTIVHEGIELLVRALGKRGLPSITSPAFREAVAEVDFWGHFARAVDQWNDRLARHPRSGPFFVLRTPPRELANRAIRLFREQYTPLDAAPRTTGASAAPSSSVEPMQLLEQRGAVSEVEVDHPALPFRGIIDLVELVDGDVQVVDFKTGKRKAEHEMQLKLYGVLWWRRTGFRPARLVVQYLNERSEWRIGEAELLAAERRLEESIDDAKRLLADTPAEARPGEDCGYCPARARCAAGWRAYQASLGRPRAGTTDLEVTVSAEPSPNGFLAETSGREVNVVYDAAVGQHLPPFEAGSCVRLLDVVVRDEGKTFEVRPWTEVYAVGHPASS